MSISLADMATRVNWTVEYDKEGHLLLIIPATRETGLLADRLYFRLMNMPEGTKVSIIFYDTDYKAFKENELGYREDDHMYGSRSYILAKRLSSDKIKTYAVRGQAHVNTIANLIQNVYDDHRGNTNTIVYGLSASNYRTDFFKMMDTGVLKETENLLGVYINGTRDRGLMYQLLESTDDAVGISNRPFDDSIQMQMTISTLMFNVLNSWASGRPLVNDKVKVDMSTGEITPL